jgi:methyltransferase family protein
MWGLPMAASDIEGRAAFLWVYDEWLASNPRQGAIAVEVGVALGRSVAHLAERCLVAGRRDIQVYAVDPWGGYARNGEQQRFADAVGGDFTLYCEQMRRHAPEAFEFVKVLRCTGVAAARLFDKVDLLVLDGDHSYEAVSEEIRAWRAWANPAIIGGDDHHEIEYPGVVRACREAFPGGYEVRNEANWPTFRWVNR